MFLAGVLDGAVFANNVDFDFPWVLQLLFNLIGDACPVGSFAFLLGSRSFLPRVLYNPILSYNVNLYLTGILQLLLYLVCNISR